MPIDPATVPPLTDADIVSILREVGYVISSERDADIVKNNPYGVASARAAYVLAASRVDTAEVERRAARKAWDAAMAYCLGGVHGLTDAIRKREQYLAREYPATAPRESLCMRCGESYRADEDHATDDCIKYLASEVKRLAAEVGQ